MSGEVLFEFGKQKKQQEAIAIVNALLEPVYSVHFGRSQPANLARVIVEQSFRMDTLKGPGRALAPIEAIVHSVEALKAAYWFLDVGSEAKSACAAALSLLIRRAFAFENASSLTPVCEQYLSIIASTLQADRQWEDALGRLPEGQPGAQAAVSA